MFQFITHYIVNGNQMLELKIMLNESKLGVCKCRKGCMSKKGGDHLHSVQSVEVVCSRWWKKKKRSHDL